LGVLGERSERLNITWPEIAYLVVLFGTFTETSGQGLARKAHAMISAGIIMSCRLLRLVCGS
jgi:hypothetical protein